MFFLRKKVKERQSLFDIRHVRAAGFQNLQLGKK